MSRTSSTDPPFPPVPPDVPALLRALLTADPGRPRATWYGEGGERVELSAKVLDNWVAKSANLLVDELDVGPGSAVLVDLPAHWRTLAWLLAVWASGATAVLPGPGVPPTVPELPVGLHPDAVLTTRPSLWSAAGTGTGAGDGAGDGGGAFTGAAVLAVALPALATRFPADLPAGTLDVSAEVRGHGDVFVPVVRPVPGDPALVTADGGVTTHADLLVTAAAGRPAGRPPGVRLLTGAGPDRAVTDWLPALLAGGSLVLHHDLAGLAPADRERLIAQEGVTAVDR